MQDQAYWIYIPALINESNYVISPIQYMVLIDDVQLTIKCIENDYFFKESPFDLSIIRYCYI
jgi:hypothetical protein